MLQPAAVMSTVAVLATLMGAVQAGCRFCAGPTSPLANGSYLPCAPGNELCPADQVKYCGAGRLINGRDSSGFAHVAPWGKPRGFHIRDLTCGLNDPNGPVYDATHKMVRCAVPCASPTSLSAGALLHPLALWLSDSLAL